jgi:hypothetical protein
MGMNQPGIGAALKTGVAFTAVAVRFKHLRRFFGGQPCQSRLIRTDFMFCQLLTVRLA